MEEKQKFNQGSYANEYTKKNYDRITILRKKGDKQKLKKLADNRNISITEFINLCIDEKLKRMKIEL